MAGESSGRGAVLYWLAFSLLVIGVIAIALLVFRDPGLLGI